MEKIKIVMGWLKNIKKIIFFREFFIFYLIRIAELNKLPKDKEYLSAIPGIVGGYCAMQFIFYAPVYMEPCLKALAQEIFTDQDSRELYMTLFLRNMYSSHFIPGWEKYYESGEIYSRRLLEIKSAIVDDVMFKGNFFTTKTRNNKNFSLRFVNGLFYILPINWFEISVFSFKLGLVYLEDKYLNYIKDKYLVDVGAFVGDSSIVLAEYTNKKVIAIEPGKNNYDYLQKTIALNNLQDKIDTFNTALDKEIKKVGIIDHGAGSRIVEATAGDNLTTITLDELVYNKYQKVGIIKMDVEGVELDILLGSEHIIKRDHPILLISIYHSGEQFINIPLYFKEKYSDIYDFKFIDCNPVHPIAEKVFLCLPKNI
jgi:FkbM family methyltransferase